MQSRDEYLHEVASGVTQRVDADRVGLDPITILGIITQVLPLLISCFKRNDVATSNTEIYAAVRRQCSTPQGRLAMRRRAMRRIRSESDERLTRAQAFEMADAVIEECLNSNPQLVDKLCMMIGPDEFGRED